MIEYIKGEITSITPADLVIETAGIGYLVNITLSTFDTLENQKSAKLLIHEAIREDAHTLYGFLTERERQLFRLLIGVSGIGANTARLILSAIPVAELEQAIAAGDHSRLKNVKGIGTKTAQRIIVDLRDKIKPADDTLLLQPVSGNEAYEEALAALQVLGFPRAASQKALKKVFENDPAARADVAIKRAMALM